MSKKRDQLIKKLRDGLANTDPDEAKAVLESLPKLDDGKGVLAIGTKKKGKK
jgi:hypothetical protein